MRKGHLCYSFHILKEYTPCGPILSLNNVSFMKNPWESRKGKRAQETQWLEGMPKSQEKVITKIKWVCPRKAMKKEKRQIKGKRQKQERNDTKSRTADSDP
jgi:hypothetical protein